MARAPPAQNALAAKIRLKMPPSSVHRALQLAAQRRAVPPARLPAPRHQASWFGLRQWQLELAAAQRLSRQIDADGNRIRHRVGIDNPPTARLKRAASLLGKVAGKRQSYAHSLDRVQSGKKCRQCLCISLIYQRRGPLWLPVAGQSAELLEFVGAENGKHLICPIGVVPLGKEYPRLGQAEAQAEREITCRSECHCNQRECNTSFHAIHWTGIAAECSIG